MVLEYCAFIWWMAGRHGCNWPDSLADVCLVGTATGYVLDNQGSIPTGSNRFFCTSQHPGRLWASLSLTQPPIQLVPEASSLGVKWWGCEADSLLADFYTLKLEAILSSETSVYTISTWRHIPEDGILQV
jgi:hypothetical protein